MGVAVGTFLQILLGESPRKNFRKKKLKSETNVGNTLKSKYKGRVGWIDLRHLVI